MEIWMENVGKSSSAHKKTGKGDDVRKDEMENVNNERAISNNDIETREAKKPEFDDTKADSSCPSTRELFYGKDVVCWRGLLTKILVCPYERRKSLQFSVCCIGGVLFLMEFESHEELRKRLNMTEHHERSCYAGFRFESYCTSKKDVTRVGLSESDKMHLQTQKSNANESPSTSSPALDSSSSLPSSVTSSLTTKTRELHQTTKPTPMPTPTSSLLSGIGDEFSEEMLHQCGAFQHEDTSQTEEDLNGAVVNTNEAYCSVVTTKLGNTSILLSGGTKYLLCVVVMVVDKRSKCFFVSCFNSVISQVKWIVWLKMERDMWS
eukprot:m.87291 g.87291  ORF g.87291 m.87291 type:complete len:321 (+) comp12237_c0_seq2:429-1391(+)